jgi:hypothetical protein
MLFIFQQENLKQKGCEQRVIRYVRDISKFCLSDIEIVSNVINSR